MTKILYVCLGNICRSPLAEAIMKKMISEAGLNDQFEVDSCGTSDYHIGELPDARTMDNARAQGVEIKHRGRQLMPRDFEYFDYLLVMDDQNFANAQRVQPAGSKGQLMKLRDFDTEDRGADVPDPYYGGPEGFQLVFDLLMRSNAHFLKYLQK
ncbi:low molecular weight protein-tyrosine-phosphatase [Persicobacter psychrovividus]|uniref:protein-tyrosine-phosphatase n=1 Tax=Persicobacter psychrovividus TaxID=387638 RepID=A0ABN6L9N5_9BACT|nr:phosphotyrosine protein phosphatase [Persicobacter psychrovividus]